VMVSGKDRLCAVRSHGRYVLDKDSVSSGSGFLVATRACKAARSLLSSLPSARSIHTAACVREGSLLSRAARRGPQQSPGSRKAA